ncbi:uncharacterized protein LOC103573849 isoform X2 [Microplitis demolitor]|uniref:uncharacterized protein LOC103573849 isoform X2 n=1 Tax=Microplitis demolitor TaxID=69319 RepID=UPI00235B62EA|nr:uncharacterized protein LOC103573849 isoform X2 [Microplitis demolitor]
MRYPGIAQVDIQNFKTCILSENNRFLLLRWLYIQGINKINNLGYKSLNYSQETEETNTLAFDERFLMNWYSQSGICTSEEALRGQCQLKHQLDTLVSLTAYIINVLHSEIDVLPGSVWNLAENYFVNPLHLIPLSYNINKNLKIDQVKQYLKNIQEGSKDQCEFHTEPVKKKLENFMYENETSNDRKIENQGNKKIPTCALMEFSKNFESFEDGINPKIPFENTKGPDILVGNINTKLSDLNKVLHAQRKICSNEFPAQLIMQKSSLDLMTENIIVKIDNLSKLRCGKY